MKIENIKNIKGIYHIGIKEAIKHVLNNANFYIFIYVDNFDSLIFSATGYTLSYQINL